MTPSAIEQALSGKLVAEINNGIQCVAANITLQQELAVTQEALVKARVRIQELENQLNATPPSKSKSK